MRGKIILQNKVHVYDRTQSVISKTNTHFFIPEKSVQKSGINENYLTVGVGTVVSMLLIVILVKLSMKSRSGKRKTLNEQRRNVNKIRDEFSIQHRHGEVEEYTKILSSQHLSHLYQPVDAVYHEIDECMELMITPSTLPQPLSKKHKQ